MKSKKIVFIALALGFLNASVVENELSQRPSLAKKLGIDKPAATKPAQAKKPVAAPAKPAPVAPAAAAKQEPKAEPAKNPAPVVKIEPAKPVLSLARAYELALQNDNDLKRSHYEAQAASSKARQSFAALLPSINAEMVYNIEKYKKNNKNIDETSNRYGLGLNQPLFRTDLWYDDKLSGLREYSSQLIFDATKQELAAKLSQAYFTYIFDTQALELAKSYAAAAAARFERTQKSLLMGLANKIDSLEAKLHSDQAELEVAKAKRKIEISRLALVNIIGSEDEKLPENLSIDLSFFKALDLQKFKNIEQNFDYRQSKIASEHAEGDLTKKWLSYAPTLDLHLGFYQQNYKDKKSFADEKNKFQATIRFNLPLYSGGATKASVEESQLNRLATLENESKVKKQTELKQRQARSDFLSYLAEYELSQSAIEHAQLLEHSIEQAYSHGLKSLVDLLEARAKLFKARSDALASSHKLVLAYIDLYANIAELNQDTINILQKSIK